MNIELLNKIKEHIAADGSRWTFLWAYPSKESPCGTQACIAGWAMVLSGKLTAKQLLTKRWGRVDATEVLDLSTEQAGRLFIFWPAPFKDHTDEPQAACARIDHFIKTNGAE